MTVPPLEAGTKAETPQPTPVTSPQPLVRVADPTNADYGDWADE